MARTGQGGRAPRAADIDRLEAALRDLVVLWRAQDSTSALGRRLDAPADLARIALPAYPFEKRRHWVLEDTPAPESEPEPEPERGPEPVDDGLVDQLCAQLSDLLGFEEGSGEVVPGTRIVTLGLDSLSAVQLLSPYQKAGSPIKAHDLFRHETVAELAAAIGGTPAGPKKEARAPGDAAADPARPARRAAPLIKWAQYGDTGRPTLLLPPLNCDQRAWTQQIPALLREGRKIYVPTYPGHADTPFDEERFSFEALADEVADFLRDTAGGPADLVGWSLGGCVSTLTALRHPERVASLTLVSCAPRYGEDAFERTLDLREELRVHGGLLEAVFGAGGNLAERFGANASMDILRCYYAALTDFDVVDRLPDLTTDCLVVRGLGDCVLDEEAVAQYAKVPRARVREFADHGHYVPLTAARDFNTTLTEFWAERA